MARSLTKMASFREFINPFTRILRKQQPVSSKGNAQAYSMHNAVYQIVMHKL